MKGCYDAEKSHIFDIFLSGLLEEATPPSAGFLTWEFISSCTSTTSCPAWGPAYRNISGGKGELVLCTLQCPATPQSLLFLCPAATTEN